MIMLQMMIVRAAANLVVKVEVKAVKDLLISHLLHLKLKISKRIRVVTQIRAKIAIRLLNLIVEIEDHQIKMIMMKVILKVMATVVEVLVDPHRKKASIQVISTLTRMI